MTDRCRGCGSDNLFSGFFDADDLAVSDDRQPGSRYTTFCNECGDEWTGNRTQPRSRT